MRLVIRIVGTLFLLLALGLGLLWIFQDNLVKSAIEGGGTWATGVETRVEDVSAGIVGGSLGLAGLRIANPPGFGTQPFFALRAARADWDPRSLLADEIHVRELALDGLALRIERNDSGTNYGRILDHVRSRGGAKSDPPAEAAAGPGRALVVDRIVLTDLSAELVLSGTPLATGPLRVSVPRVEIGAFRSDGATHEIVGTLLSAVVRAALEASLQAGAGVFPKDLARDLESRLAGAKAELERQLGGSLEDAVKQATEGVQKKLGGLQDALGGKKP
ncbi:MAG: hypothetical protein JNK02_12300 [Planctomycetes bacterium]|nr:hypothetical protein [Planctomycetota bacterium]